LQTGDRAIDKATVSIRISNPEIHLDMLFIMFALLL
jgi:hypothetical protein